LNEYRRAKRRRVERRVDVLDCMTGRIVGHVSDLSETGMLLIANQQLASDALYQFRFSLPDADGQDQVLDVGAHELWSDQAAAPGQIWTGLRFIDIAAPHLQLLRSWVTAPGSEHV
jgi:hypothetical protein